MRRQDIQLLAQARQGDSAARCEVGRRYLLGVNGFPQHVATGLEYLRHPSLAGKSAPARILAEALPLDQLMALQQGPALALAAADGCLAAQLKLGLWRALQADGRSDALRWLGAAAKGGQAGGHAGAAQAVAALAQAAPAQAVLAVLQPLADGHGIDGPLLACLAARQAIDGGQRDHLVACLVAALALGHALDSDLASLVVAAEQLADQQGRSLAGLPTGAVLDSLELRAGQGDRAAAYSLGRGLSGIAITSLEPDVFAGQQNLRKGAAFLLRAADAGQDAAWLHLYKLHADHRSSVANPQLARFFLEKAALRGQAEAQRKLGALQLREASHLQDSEQAIHWLHQAAAQGDAHARTLLQSLLLPVADVDAGEAEVAFALEQVRRADPWLAQRLALSRAFGLTKLEALSVDPVAGLRPWGLVVGRNPFIAQVRLSAPRAVPAVDDAALAVARRAAAFFGQAQGEAGAAEGDLRARSLRQRRLFERLGMDEAAFFCDASAMTLDALRLGAKWAYRARAPLSEALAA
jgi:TPR repeat protein